VHVEDGVQVQLNVPSDLGVQVQLAPAVQAQLGSPIHIGRSTGAAWRRRRTLPGAWRTNFARLRRHFFGIRPLSIG
jgi:hypothetical protein